MCGSIVAVRADDVCRRYLAVLREPQMSALLELLGKGLENGLMWLVLPDAGVLRAEDVKRLSENLADRGDHAGDKLRLAVHYAQSGASEQAEKILTEMLDKNPGQVDGYLVWAAMHASAGELDEAIEQLERGRVQDSKDVRVLFGLGYCHERAGRADEALGFYEQAALVGRGLRQVRERLAALHVHAGDYESAIKCCTELQKEYPEDVWLYLVLGQMYLELGKAEEAAGAFERALTIEPDNFSLDDEKVAALVKDKRIEEAIERVAEIIDEQGEFADSYVQLGDLYSQVGNDASAVKNYSKAMALHNGYLEASVKLGTQHLRMGRYRQAVSSFTRAVEINDQLLLGYVGLCVAQQEEGKRESAAETLGLALAIEPNTNLLFAEVARLQLKIAQGDGQAGEYGSYSGQGTVDQAELDGLLTIQLDRHRAGLDRNPYNADLQYRYAVLLRGQGDTAEAIEHFRQAVQINPAYSQAQVKLGLALQETHSQAEAMGHLRAALSLPSEYATLHYKLGLLYCDKMKFALTVEEYAAQDGENVDPGNIEVNLLLSLRNMGLIDRAEGIWRAVCELDPESVLAYQSQRGIVVGERMNNKNKQ